jgi:hypothetical protein
MFLVKRVLRQGFFRDKVLIVATDDASISRKRLGLDLLGAPDIKIECLRVSRGQEFVVALPTGATTEGQQISAEQVSEMRGFSPLWSAAAGP